MAEPGRVTYRVLVSDGNYSHVEIGVELPIDSGESLEAAMERARAQVRKRVKADYRKMGSLRGWEEDGELPAKVEA
jgi:hypothetical protein